MHPRFYLALLLVLPFWPGCTRKNCCVMSSGSHVFNGSWQLVRVTGGLAGATIGIPADSVVMLTLDSRWSYTYTVNGVAKGSGQYSIVDISLGARDTIALRFSGDTTVPYFFDVRSDTLQLSQHLDDGFVFLYKRSN